MVKRQFLPIPKNPNSGAIKIAVLYFLLGWLWILLSDKAAAAIALNREVLTNISLYKGSTYVLVTALLLYWLIQRNTAALRTSEAQLQQVLDTLPVLISYVDAQGYYRFTNKTYEQWFGDTAQGKTWQEVTGKASQTISKYVDKALQGEIVNYESVLSYPQGERFIHATYVPDQAADGRVKGFFALVEDITESKQAREELRQWADAFNGCAHGIAIGDPETNQIVVCNPAFARLHKCRVEDIVGSAIISLYAPADHAHVRQNIQQADQSGRASYEARMIRRDGSTFPVQMDLVSVHTENGELLYRVATAQDISERKRAEEESKSLARFPNENPNPVLRVTHAGQIIYANAASELLLNDWRCQVGDNLPVAWMALIKELANSGARKTIDIQCKDIIYSILLAPIPDAGYINLYGRDVTERKRAETALLESSMQFRTLFEASPDANMLIYPRGTWPIMDCNAAACQMNGYTHDELIGQPVDILNPHPWQSAKRDEYLVNIRQAGVLRYETMHRRKDGTEFPIEVSTSLISLSGHEVLLGIDRDITERKRSEENLRRFELLSEHSRDIILFMGREDGRILEANAAATQAYGYSRAELLTFTIWDLRAPDTQNLTIEQMAEADASGILFETIHHRKDGTTFPVEVSSRGAIIGGVRMLISIVRDITERKKAQAAALENEQRYHRVLDTLMEGCQIIDFGWRYVYVNQVVTEQGRHKPEELLGRTMMEVYPGMENTELFSNMRQCMEARLPKRMENRFVFPDGNLGWFELSIQPVEEGIFILSTDVTERKRAERALRESQVRLSFALEKSHTGGWDLDLVDHTALRTLEHDRIFGYESLLPEWTYEIFLEHVLPDDRAEVDRLFQEATSTQTNWGFECRIRRTDGEIRWIRAVGGHLFDDTGQAYHMAGIVQDITERKQAEQEIHLLNERLEQRVVERTAQLESANKELEAFSYSVSHDLRAPLRAIDGYTRILVEDYEANLDEEGKRVCGTISAEARRMGQLIDDLLSFSRLGRKAMYFSKIDMKTMAESIFNELSKGADQGRIDFQITKLPAVNADPTLIRQVWVNLLSNAIKFTSKKEHALVKVGSKHSAEEYVYYVRDTGAGFDMEYVDKLFGVFQRLHGESEFEGTGVGLAIIQRIIRRHGGRVWAEGELEKGATFYFSLPRQESSHDE